MRFNKLDLNLLVALDAMLQTRSITQAAHRLHMTQPALSNSLARLRDYFGDELLVPVGRGMELTRRGEDLREAVRDLLLRVETVVHAQPEFDATRSERVFKIAASDYSAWVLMPHFLAWARSSGATVGFEILPQVGDSARALERGEADVLIIPKAYCSPAHPADFLFEETYICLVWQGSVLAQNSESIDLSRYLQAGHVVMQPAGTAQPAFAEACLREAGWRRRVAVATHSFLSEPALVVGTDHIATVHARLADWACACLPLKRLPLPIALPPMQQAMQWHKHRASDPALRWLLAALREAARRMDALAPT